MGNVSAFLEASSSFVICTGSLFIVLKSPDMHMNMQF